MKVTKLLVLGAMAALMVTSLPCFAQHGGFQTGIARPTFGFPPTQAPVTVRGGTFIGNGGFTTFQVIVVPVPVPIQPVLIPQQPILIPNQILMPPAQPFPVQNPVFIPNQFLLPGQTFVPPPVVQPAPAIIHVHAPRFPAAAVPVPVAGTPLPQLIQQFGQPTVRIITSRGEILQFTGGVTVTIQNGQVAGPR